MRKSEKNLNLYFASKPSSFYEKGIEKLQKNGNDRK